MRGDKVAFLLDDGEDRLRRLGSIVDATAGVFAGRGPVLSVEELREEAERAIAEDTAEHSRLEPVNDYETPSGRNYCSICSFPVASGGGLIQAAVGSSGGRGAPPTKRSGAAA